MASRGLHLRPRRRRWRRWVGLGLIIVVVAGLAAVARAATLSPPALTANRVLPASVTISGAPPAVSWPGQGQAALEAEGLGAFGSHGPTTPQPIASLAKVMTAYLVLRDHPLGPGQSGFEVTISGADVADYHARQAAAQSVVEVAEGEVLSELQMLEALLIASANNVAPLLARYDAGSESAFIAKMNTTAKSLGMTDTTYTDTSGFNPTTVSTAGDQLLLAREAMTDPVFAQVVAMKSVALPVAGTVTNFNQLVGTGGFDGIKTGSDSAAGGCLMFANRQTVGGHPVTLLGVVLGQDVGQSTTSVLIGAATSAATAMVHSAVAAIGVRTVLPAGTVVETVTNADGRHVPIRLDSAIQSLGWGGQTLPLSWTPARLGSHVTAGQVVGTVSAAGGQVSIRASSGVPAAGWGWRMSHLFGAWVGAVWVVGRRG